MFSRKRAFSCPKLVPEIIDPVFTKTSQNARFLLSENERFGLVFVKTGSINSGTGLLIRAKVSEAALQSENSRRETALQIRCRPLLHSTNSTVPDSFVLSHRQRRKRKTIAETHDSPHHRDDGPPCVRQPGQAMPGGSTVPAARGGGPRADVNWASAVCSTSSIPPRQQHTILNQTDW